jgi:hypothetical protein
MATSIHYKATTLRSLGWPVAIVAVAAAVVPWFSGLTHTVRGAETSRPDAGHAAYTREVLVANPARGCRWQYTTQAEVQIADCGDESESVRLVFERGQVTEYRIVAKQDPNAAPRTSSTSALTSQNSSSVLPPAPRANRSYPPAP